MVVMKSFVNIQEHLMTSYDETACFVAGYVWPSQFFCFCDKRAAWQKSSAWQAGCKKEVHKGGARQRCVFCISARISTAPNKIFPMLSSTFHAGLCMVY